MDEPDDRHFQNLPDPYFAPKHLPSPRLQYVAWIDLMGTASMMEFSFTIAATNICKFHLSIKQQEEYDKFKLYPMNDGIYVVSDELYTLKKFLQGVFSDYSKVLISQHGRSYWDIKFTAIPRAAIAYGKLYHGNDISDTILTEYEYLSTILLGQPMARAHQKEREAAPFGIIVDSSVDDSEPPIKWWTNEKNPRIVYLILEEYFEACDKNPDIHYPKHRLKEHRSQAKEYLLEH